MSACLERAVILIEQSRYELADRELRHQLAIDPNNPYTHALLSICLVERQQDREATEEAELAVSLAPDLSDTHYTLAKVLYIQSQFDKAKIAVGEAIRLESEVAEYFGLLSAIDLALGDRVAALSGAEQGLSIEPDHLFCLNLRAMALLELNRYQEAQNTVEIAIAQEPENGISYTTLGWTLLHCGKFQSALKYFRLALRLNPEQERARKGMVEALKSRYRLYRLIFKYELWLSKLDLSLRYFIIFSIFLLSIFKLFFLLFLVLILLLGIAKPVFTLILRLDNDGRLSLSPKEIAASNWSGLAFLLAIIAFVGWIITSNFAAACVGVFCLFLVKIIALDYPAVLCDRT